MFLVVYKIACITLFAFFYDQSYSWLLVTLLLTGSAYNYYKCKVGRPYYSETLAVLWNLTNAIYLYINVVLFMCMLLRNTSFSGGLQMVVIGVPVVLVAEYFSPHPSAASIAQRFDQLTSGSDCTMYLRYFSHIVRYRTDPDCSIPPKGTC